VESGLQKPLGLMNPLLCSLELAIPSYLPAIHEHGLKDLSRPEVVGQDDILIWQDSITPSGPVTHVVVSNSCLRPFRNPKNGTFKHAIDDLRPTH